MQIGPYEHAYKHHDEEERDQAGEFEYVALFQLAAADFHFFLRLFVRLFLHSLDRARDLLGVVVLFALVLVFQCSSSCYLVVAARFVVLFLEGGEHAPCLLHVRPDGLADAFGFRRFLLLRGA